MGDDVGTNPTDTSYLAMKAKTVVSKSMRLFWIRASATSSGTAIPKMRQNTSC
ncbi:hypothetical protein OH492_09255 [Vibrio chagasii]|nr:hypothetical protein [Vibrio chagasii]